MSFGAALAVAAAVLSVAPVSAAATFTFTGRGWGHGIGMSQWGARGLASKGWDVGRILRHYYRGTEIERKTLPREIRVGLQQERSEIAVTGNGAFEFYDNKGKLRVTANAGPAWKIIRSGTQLKVVDPKTGHSVFSSPVPVTIRYESKGTVVKLPSGFGYKRGRIDIDMNPSTKKLRSILIIGSEEYLWGLGEMPSSWPPEALKAQAIAARTYAYEKITRLGQKRSVCNCAVYASTADQAYVGVQHEVSAWTSQVKATAGQVVTYQGKPIQAFYSASSGGYTENNENVWGGDPLPYLRGTCDPGDYDGGADPHSNWSITIDGADLAKKLRDSGHDVGTVQAVDFPSPRGVSGRVNSVIDDDHGGVRIRGSSGTVRLSGSTFRAMLGAKSNLFHYMVYGAIRKKWDAMNCGLGLPRWHEVTWFNLDGTNRGRAQNFNKGRIYWDRSTGRTTYIGSGIRAYYDARRAAKQDFGLPIADEGSVSGGRKAPFERGTIYWSKSTGTHAVYGGIGAKYQSTGASEKWGLPTTDERWAPLNGRTQRFTKARIYWSPKYGARIVYGGILQKYIELGGGTGKLGMPKSDEYSVSGGRRQDFVSGYITWTRSTGALSYKLT